MPAICDPSYSYRREARRLRGHLAGRPIELYRSLRRLSDRHDACVPDSSEDQVTACHESFAAPDRFRSFADQVGRCLDGEILSYSRRLRLLKSADGLGIGRFQANLIIAAIQHRFGQAAASTIATTRRPTAGWLVFLLVQSLILILAWAAFIR